MDEPFVWFPRSANPAFYDRMMHACYRGGLKSPRIVQEGFNEATILSLVSTGLGVGWVLGSARWRCPETLVILPVVDLNVPVTLALAWRRDSTLPCPQISLVRYSACQTCERSIKREGPSTGTRNLTAHCDESVTSLALPTRCRTCGRTSRTSDKYSLICR
jgi:hypothetical protein